MSQKNYQITLNHDQLLQVTALIGLANAPKVLEAAKSLNETFEVFNESVRVDTELDHTDALYNIFMKASLADANTPTNTYIVDASKGYKTKVLYE